MDGVTNKYDSTSVSKKRNAHEKLPLDLSFESKGVEDRVSIEYTRRASFGF